MLLPALMVGALLLPIIPGIAGVPIIRGITGAITPLGTTAGMIPGLAITTMAGIVLSTMAPTGVGAGATDLGIGQVSMAGITGTIGPTTMQIGDIVRGLTVLGISVEVPITGMLIFPRIAIPETA